MKKVLIIIGIVVIFIILTIVSCACNGIDQLFSFNLIDILTLGIASILIYYLTEKNVK